MSTPFKDHASDRAVRQELIVKLIALRVQQGLTPTELSRRAGMPRGWAGHGEHEVDSFVLSRVFLWSNALQHETVIHYNLPDQVKPAVDAFGEISRLVAMWTRDPYWRASWEIARAVGTRVSLGLERADVAKAMDNSVSSVKDWEVQRKATTLSNLQRYIRAIGGRLAIDLVPLAAVPNLAHRYNDQA